MPFFRSDKQSDGLHHVVMGIDDAGTIGAENAATVFADNFQNPFLSFLAFFTGFGKSRGLHHNKPDALCAAIGNGRSRPLWPEQ